MWMDKEDLDLGQYEVTKKDSHKDSFKTPILSDRVVTSLAVVGSMHLHHIALVLVCAFLVIVGFVVF